MKDTRGFRIYTEFKDKYGSDVTVKMASNVNKRCWIFATQDTPQFKTDGAINLDNQQVKRLIKALERFLKNK